MAAIPIGASSRFGRPRVVAGLATGWYLGSTSMAAFGLLVLLGVMVALPALPLGPPSASGQVARPPAGGS